MKRITGHKFLCTSHQGQGRRGKIHFYLVVELVVEENVNSDTETEIKFCCSPSCAMPRNEQRACWKHNSSFIEADGCSTFNSRAAQ